MAHIHDHEHSHAHAHAPRHFGRAFAVAVALNFALVLLQLVYGVIANSVALLADAGHNFGDVLGLLLAWGAHSLAQRGPTKHYTYGYQSASVLAALLNAVILLVATGAIAWEAIRRFSDPGEVASTTVMIVAGIGILVNAISAWLFMAGRERDLNIRGAFLHLVGDAAVSAGVVLSGAVIYFTNWNWLDPVASLMIAIMIASGTWGLLRDATKLSLDAVPSNIDPGKVKQYLRTLPGVSDVHDLHIWAMSTTETALTAHLIRPDGKLDDSLLRTASDGLAHRFGIRHTTLQVEVGDTDPTCPLAPDTVI